MVINSLSNFRDITNCFPVYFDASDDCHELGFGFGQAGVAATIPTTRSFSIKVCHFNQYVSVIEPEAKKSAMALYLQNYIRYKQD